MKSVKVIQTFADSVCHPAGAVEYVVDSVAAEWINAGLAVETDELPEYITQIHARMAQGAGKPCLFLPFVGEFGHMIMSHIRMVHFHKASRKIVCCRPGEEVLFPSADVFHTDWRDPLSDEIRVGTVRDRRFHWPHIVDKYPYAVRTMAGRLTMEQELYAIEPAQRIPFRPKQRGLQADVLIGVRHRKFMPERNWAHWQTLADAITDAGYTFAVIGDMPTSYDLVGQECHSGHHDTDAAIELMHNCRLYIGTDSGASHLAATVGTHMLTFREWRSGSRNLIPRMSQVNPGRVMFVPTGWDEPELVIAAALDVLRTPRSDSDVHGG